MGRGRTHSPRFFRYKVSFDGCYSTDALIFQKWECIFVIRSHLCSLSSDHRQERITGAKLPFLPFQLHLSKYQIAEESYVK